VLGSIARPDQDLKIEIQQLWDGLEQVQRDNVKQNLNQTHFVVVVVCVVVSVSTKVLRFENQTVAPPSSL
jgi:hypothetical protein